MVARWLLLPASAAAEGNMNGFYPLSSTPGGKPGLMPREFKDYPGEVESFDVYSPPIETLYSQVFWTGLAPVDLPEEVVKKYEGKGMAILGWEIDQVRKTKDGDVSVPIVASYNHHFSSSMIGGDAKYREVRVSGPEDPLASKVMKASGCGRVPWNEPQYIVEGPTSSSRGLPTHQLLQSGNGGEYRKTFHGFAPGQALVVDSPKQLQITPMQIDTWNRDEMDISGPLPPKFVPGPLPRASLASKTNPVHSGLLECPMTTRLTKVVDSSEYTEVSEAGKCVESIVSFYECFEAAPKVLDGAVLKKHNGFAKDKPAGCTATPVAGGYEVFFNEEGSSLVECSETGRCICAKEVTSFGQAKGALLYHQTNQSADVGKGKAAYFERKCEEWPATNLLEHRNPTCDIRYYQGGQWACNHGWSLLDADQEIPWTNQPLIFHHKYRFWVQPYNQSFHQPLVNGESTDSHLLIGSPWEYDVPKCADGVPGCSLEDGTWVHTINGSMMGHMTFAYLNTHCHAATCLSTKVYACKKGTPLEQCNEHVGKPICETKPIFGGTGHPDINGTRFDEPGYIALPACLWGDEAYGLEPPLQLEGVPLHVVKKANATEGHYGEMSGGQPWVLLNSMAPEISV